MGESNPSSTSPPLIIPSAPAQHISPHITLQPPLSRRGRGPGLVLVADHYALLEHSTKSLDPPPLIKWAEEGFAVVQVLVPAKVEEDGGEFPLKKAVETLRACESCEFGKGGEEGGGVGLVSYLSRVPFYVEEAACVSPDIKAIISYGGRKFTSLSTSLETLPPQLLHIPGKEAPRRESISIVPEPETSSLSHSSSANIIKSFRYVDAKQDSGWILPNDEDYHAPSAKLAHTRSLTFLKPLLKGPWFDLEAIWDEHCLYEFGERDVARTMATMVAQPYVNHIPTMTGGIGQDRLTAFYTHHFVFANPDDTQLALVNRTVGVDRVIDEFVFKLTHDRQVDWLLPGIPPTGKFLEIPFTSVVAMRGDRLCHEHIHWDQGTAMQQAGLLPEWVPFNFPIDGKEAAEGKKFEVQLPTAGVQTARKLVDEGDGESNGLMQRRWREV